VFPALVARKARGTPAILVWPTPQPFSRILRAILSLSLFSPRPANKTFVVEKML
jgi:hypothetical protein